MEESIASHVTRCLGLFDNAVGISETIAPGPEASFNRSVRDERTRFKVWSGNIGAHRTGMSSLDHRLRDSSNIRNQVVNLLLDLDGLLEDAIAIITGEEPSWDQISSDWGVFLDQDAEESDSPDTELEQISVDVADVVNCLLRLNVAIRNPAPHDRFVESHSTDTSHYEPFDIEHVYSKFKSIDPGLAERLGKAISRRRQFFKYREAHRMKLSHGIDYHYLRDAETIASSLPEHFKDKIGASQFSRLPVFEDNYSDAGVSQTSYATSATDTEQRRVPPLPAEASKGPFECPFCFMIIAVTDRSSWK
ncbi:C2H2-type domain-containing protein [Fusarium keratoplasticum]|nr:C2H2-type domain-containing protein [Fusarium keratoplasticum]